MSSAMIKKQRAFTLIELLVVITIIGILLSLLLVGVEASRKSARDGRRKADLEQIRNALQMCRSDLSSYPVGTTLPSAGGVNCTSYLPSVPTDPITGRLYPYSGAANTYTLCAALENQTTAVSGCGSCGSGTCSYKVTQP